MNKPNILGVEVITPDGRGSILSLHNGCVKVSLHKIKPGQVMKGRKDKHCFFHYAYNYEDVEIIKGQYSFKQD